MAEPTMELAGALHRTLIAATPQLLSDPGRLRALISDELGAAGHEARPLVDGLITLSGDVGDQLAQAWPAAAGIVGPWTIQQRSVHPDVAAQVGEIVVAVAEGRAPMTIGAGSMVPPVVPPVVPPGGMAVPPGGGFPPPTFPGSPPPGGTAGTGGSKGSKVLLAVGGVVVLVLLVAVGAFVWLQDGDDDTTDIATVDKKSTVTSATTATSVTTSMPVTTTDPPRTTTTISPAARTEALIIDTVGLSNAVCDSTVPLDASEYFRGADAGLGCSDQSGSVTYYCVHFPEYALLEKQFEKLATDYRGSTDTWSFTEDQGGSHGNYVEFLTNDETPSNFVWTYYEERVMCWAYSAAPQSDLLQWWRDGSY